MAPKKQWRSRILRHTEEPAAQLTINPDNFRIHSTLQQQAMSGVLDSVGWIAEVIVSARTKRIIDGHLRVALALRDNPDATVPVTWVDLDEQEEKLALRTFNPLGELAEQDFDALARLEEQIEAFDAAQADLLQYLDLDAMPSQVIVEEIDEEDDDETDSDDEADGEAEAGAEDEEEEEWVDPAANLPDPGDVIFPSDNEWGIPLLDIRMQAEGLVLPVTKWGTIARNRAMPGTYSFYTDDYKWNALWAYPQRLLVSGCKAIFEPNYSTNTHMPAAIALWRIYQKRWMARWWQTQGIRVLVDLNVESAFADLNLLGVPRGWRAYVTRGYSDHLDDLTRELDRARAHADPEIPILVVVGGGHDVIRYCKERALIYVPEDRDVIGQRPALKLIENPLA